MTGNDKKINDFLNKYKELESSIRKVYGENYTVYMYEDEKVNVIDKPCLTFCRSLRNFLVHNPDKENFVTPNKETIDFLDKIIKDVLSEIETVKDNIKRYRKFYTIKDKIYDVATAMKSSKIDVVPIIDENKKVIGLFTYNTLVNITINKISASKSISNVVLDKINIPFVQSDLIYADCPDIAFVTDDGTNNGKLIGYIKK